ncbi:Chanoclavine-I aldehyde reductase fgaOx3 [Fusarium oxysporum f. sp. cubense]|uniref:Chanoclavine-I aldehyde reductase fgaOx3 n=1 Tax=Fusarium oxysporum f. sp. cubense TaxID=61366 RepID=A0A559LB76_FUSOC|nr:Chanoclavine-I aldehyde reductase fgaOx3 [Fusarium oxysporum f. sp. cubense]
MSESRLFQPMKIGNIKVQHRVGMAPLTRLRSSIDRVPNALMKEYYGQRASIPGTLIITEGTLVSLAAGGGFARTPGIWNQEQVNAWKEITDEVHRKGSFIFVQLFAMGRAATVEVARDEGIDIIGPSAIPIEGSPAQPRAMSLEEIHEIAEAFVIASENAMKAGFDGVEIHGANGYLLDQFLQDVSNQRNDEYGGSIENRSRLIAEILERTVQVIGQERVGIRLSPWSTFQSMRMKDPIPQFTDIINKASRLNLAYLHLIESRISGSQDCQNSGGERLDFAYDLWTGPFLIAGGYKLKEAERLVDEEHPNKEIMVMFGRNFLANPDLVYRIKEGLELNPYERRTFYTSDVEGYVDYPFAVRKEAAASN